MIRIVVSELARECWRGVKASRLAERVTVAWHALRGGPTIQSLHNVRIEFPAVETNLDRTIRVSNCSGLIFEGLSYHPPEAEGSAPH